MEKCLSKESQKYSAEDMQEKDSYKTGDKLVLKSLFIYSFAVQMKRINRQREYGNKRSRN